MKRALWFCLLAARLVMGQSPPLQTLYPTDLASTGPTKINFNDVWLFNNKVTKFTGSGAPSTITYATRGDIYYDTLGQASYWCLSVSCATGSPTWITFGVVTSYPGAGIPLSTGSAWGASYSTLPRSVGGTNNTAGATAQQFFGTIAPGSVTGNLPGDRFSDTTNHNDYWCNAPSGTAAPACTSVTAGGWTLANGGGGGFDTADCQVLSVSGGTFTVPASLTTGCFNISFTTTDNVSMPTPVTGSSRKIILNYTNVTPTTGSPITYTGATSSGLAQPVSPSANAITTVTAYWNATTSSWGPEAAGTSPSCGGALATGQLGAIQSSGCTGAATANNLTSPLACSGTTSCTTSPSFTPVGGSTPSAINYVAGATVTSLSLAVNGASSATVHQNGSATVSFTSGQTYQLVFDGTYWNNNGPASGGSASSVPGVWVFGPPQYSGNGAQGIAPANGGGAYYGAFLYFTLANSYSGAHFSYRVQTAASSGSNGAVFGVLSADGNFTPLCTPSVATGTNISTTGSKTLTYASGSNVSAGTCTLPVGSYLLGMTSNDTSLQILAAANGYGIMPTVNQNVVWYAGQAASGSYPFSSGSGATITWKSSATFVGYIGSGYAGIDDHYPFIFLDK